VYRLILGCFETGVDVVALGVSFAASEEDRHRSFTYKLLSLSTKAAIAFVVIGQFAFSHMPAAVTCPRYLAKRVFVIRVLFDLQFSRPSLATKSLLNAPRLVFE
jgi:hypothetical protein